MPFPGNPRVRLVIATTHNSLSDPTIPISSPPKYSYKVGRREIRFYRNSTSTVSRREIRSFLTFDTFKISSVVGESVGNADARICDQANEAKNAQKGILSERRAEKPRIIPQVARQNAG